MVTGDQLKVTVLAQVSNDGAGLDGGREVGRKILESFFFFLVDWSSSGCRVGLRGIEDNSQISGLSICKNREGQAWGPLC